MLDMMKQREELYRVSAKAAAAMSHAAELANIHLGRHDFDVDVLCVRLEWLASELRGAYHAVAKLRSDVRFKVGDYSTGTELQMQQSWWRYVQLRDKLDKQRISA